MRIYLYSQDLFDYKIFRKFYIDKYKIYNLVDCNYFDEEHEFKFIGIDDAKFKRLLIQTHRAMAELRKICNILNNYHNNTFLT